MTKNVLYKVRVAMQCKFGYLHVGLSRAMERLFELHSQPSCSNIRQSFLKRAGTPSAAKTITTYMDTICMHWVSFTSAYRAKLLATGKVQVRQCGLRTRTRPRGYMGPMVGPRWGQGGPKMGPRWAHFFWLKAWCSRNLDQVSRHSTRQPPAFLDSRFSCNQFLSPCPPRLASMGARPVLPGVRRPLAM